MLSYSSVGEKGIMHRAGFCLNVTTMPSTDSSPTRFLSDVADLVQETFAACVEACNRLVDDNKFRSYLFSIAYNVLRKHYHTKHRSGESIDFDHVSVCDLAPGPGTLVSKRREQRLLLQALRHIPVGYQVILELHYWEGMTTTTMAEILDLPVGTVRSRLRRARELLEVAMAQLSPLNEELVSIFTEIDKWAMECRRLLAR